MAFLHQREVERQSWRTMLTLSVLTSAIVGSVFGYYGASFIGPSNRQALLSGRELTDEEESSRVTSIVKQVSPAVVSIVATQQVSVRSSSSFSSRFCNDPFFRQFLEECTESPRSEGTQTREVAAGSGFIIDSQGLILTNKHVINVEGSSLVVILNDGTRHPAEILAQDPVQDIALIKISGTNFPTVSVGDSNRVAVGETVIAIGNALGEFSNSVSKGIISGLSRSVVASSGISSERLEEVIQTDAAINPGNSGGPLLNLDGEVVGINTAIASDAQNVGFAIPINQAKRDIQDVERFGKIRYPYLGLRYVLVNTSIQAQRNLDVDYGALVVRSENDPVAVIPNSPAAKAGIQEGDIILEMDGERISEDHTLAKVMQSHTVGDTVKMKIRRGGNTLSLSVTLGER